MFRQICIFDEQGTLTPDQGHWKWTYGNWNEAFEIVFRKNGKVLTSTGLVDYQAGTIKDTSISIGADNRPRDVTELTYQFDYFPIAVLEGIIAQSIDFVNTAAFGPPTNYDINTMPEWWDGVVVDASFAVCMERLILDFTLWKGRLIFALGPNSVFDGDSGDIVGQLETLKTNAEDRVSKTIENERFKIGNHLSPPTQIYYDAVRGVGSGRTQGPRSGMPYGKLRGWKSNRIWGG